MGINEIDHTIYPYTVGREDCKVLPRSFKTLADAKAYLAEQDKVHWRAASSISTGRSRTRQLSTEMRGPSKPGPANPSSAD